MKIEKLSIRAYRSIRELDIDASTNMIIIGKNNHGKTNIFKALSTILDFPDELPSSDYPVKNFRVGRITMETAISVVFSLPSESLIRSKLKNLLKKDGDKLTITMSASQQNPKIRWSVKLGTKSAQTSLSEAMNILRTRFNNEYSFIWIPSVRNLSASMLSQRGNILRELVDLIFKDTSAQPGRPTDFELKYQDLLKEGKKQLKKANQQMISIGKTYLQMDALKINEISGRASDVYDGFEFTISDGISTALLSEKGTGWQSAFVMILMEYISTLTITKKIHFAIEEPEAYLHAGAERQVVKAIRALSSKHKVWVSTHSSVVIDELTENEWTILRRIEKNNNGTFLFPKISLTTSEMSKYQFLCDSDLAELLFSDGVVFVEGPSDKGVWEYLLHEYGSTRKAIKIYDIGGCERVRTFVEFAEKYNVPWLVIIDKDAVNRSVSGSNVFNDFCLTVVNGKKRVPEDIVDEVKSLASQNTKNDKEVMEIYKKISQKINKHRIMVLPVDIEYSIVHARNEKEAIEAIKNPDVTRRGWPIAYNEHPWSLTQQKRIKEFREKLGSKGLVKKAINDPPLKVRHVPKCIVAATPKNKLRKELIEILNWMEKEL